MENLAVEESLKVSKKPNRYADIAKHVLFHLTVF
jgi:hypothetical protein